MLASWCGSARVLTLSSDRTRFFYFYKSITNNNMLFFGKKKLTGNKKLIWELKQTMYFAGSVYFSGSSFETKNEKAKAEPSFRFFNQNDKLDIKPVRVFSGSVWKKCTKRKWENRITNSQFQFSWSRFWQAVWPGCPLCPADSGPFHSWTLQVSLSNAPVRNRSYQTWQTPNIEHHHKCSIPIVQHAGGSIMLWRSFSATGPGKLAKVEGEINHNFRESSG